ncbi:MAG: 6-phosphogluconolactonase, partial [Candidatus Margulisbacteria bacterium]|nr:6-phosphogluconolactonase [Candidatus Margulisiibacteriota bacterium]
MNIIRGNKEKLETQLIDIFVKEINTLLKKKDKIIIGIPGGTSVQGIFERFKTLNITWSKVHIFLVDERLIGNDDPQSNFKLANDAFINDLINKKVLPKQNIHPFNYDPNKNDGGVSAYEKDFLKQGEAFDIVILGAGEDGHIASLFPNHPSIQDESNYFIKVKNSPKPPPLRMSATKKLISSAKISFLLFLGKNKKAALENFLNENISLAACPAKITKNIK